MLMLVPSGAMVKQYGVQLRDMFKNDGGFTLSQKSEKPPKPLDGLYPLDDVISLSHPKHPQLDKTEVFICSVDALTVGVNYTVPSGWQKHFSLVVVDEGQAVFGFQKCGWLEGQHYGCGRESNTRMPTKDVVESVVKRTSTPIIIFRDECLQFPPGNGNSNVNGTNHFPKYPSGCTRVTAPLPIVRFAPQLRDLTVPFCPTLDLTSEPSFRKSFGMYRFNSGNGHGEFGRQEILRPITGVSGVDLPYHPTLVEGPALEATRKEKDADLATFTMDELDAMSLRLNMKTPTAWDCYARQREAGEFSVAKHIKDGQIKKSHAGERVPCSFSDRIVRLPLLSGFTKLVWFEARPCV
jgi:hypothetical protein